MGGLSEQSQSNISEPQSLLLEKKIHIYFFLYSLPDLIKSENGNITVNTFWGIQMESQLHRNTTRVIELIPVYIFFVSVCITYILVYIYFLIYSIYI